MRRFPDMIEIIVLNYGSIVRKTIAANAQVLNMKNLPKAAKSSRYEEDSSSKLMLNA